MEAELEVKLQQKSVLEALQKHLLQYSTVIPFRSTSSVFFMVCKYDKSIGYPVNGKIHLNSDGWLKITELVKRLVNFDLLGSSIEDLSKLDRVEVTRSMNNEKSVGRAPSEGFIMGRMLGPSDTLRLDTKGFCEKATPPNSYAGIHISDIEKWDVGSLIIIENLAAFLAFNENHLSCVSGINTDESALIVYRGHDSNNSIYRLMTEFSELSMHKYIFADYDMAGLALSEVIAKKIGASGYILPSDKDDLNTLIRLTKSIEREKQAGITVTDSTLLPFYRSLKLNFIGVTQEALMAHGIPLSLVLINK